MAAKKQVSNPAQLLFKLKVKDERVPKLIGLLALFFALYMSIAFLSYLFTWRQDQDNVLRFSWEILLHRDIEMANWLGRLGAVMSNQFFYWWFGFPSFGFIALLVMAGMQLVLGSPGARLRQALRYGLPLIVYTSIALAFFAGQGSDFPWGGAIGQFISMWLSNFLGRVGMFILLLFVIVVYGVWAFNPDFRNITIESTRDFLRDQWLGLINGRRIKIARAAPSTAPKPSATPAKGTNTGPQVAPEAPVEQEDTLESEAKAPDAPPADVPKKSPLLFEMDEQPKPESEKTANELEIENTLDVVDASDEADIPLAPDMAVQAENQRHDEPYDPTLELASYIAPEISLLVKYSDDTFEVDRAELEANKDLIVEKLLHYKIEIEKIKATIGPTVTLYEIVPVPGVRISKIKNLEDDIAMSLSALGIRIIAPMPGRGTIGIEVPNKNKQTVGLREVLASEKFRHAKMDLPIALGKTIQNEVFVADLAKMPHLLIAGATGQGKSVGINTILMSLLYKKHPSQVKLVLIDPKKVELFPYAQLEQHFLGFLPGEDEPIVTETNKVINTLNSLCIEMDQRYDLLKRAHVRHLTEYNQKFVARRLNPEKGHRFLPFIVLVIDEFADLIMTAGKEIELPIGRLAQLARAVGIHLIIATQRPSVNIITGVIKANFPARLAFKVTSKIDSRTILDGGGAEQLIGRGDMLLSVGGDLVRLQCAFVDTPEVENVISFISQQRGYPEPFLLPEYHGDEEEHGATGYAIEDLDDHFDDAARLVVQNQLGSTSMLQRRLKLGYNRAGRIMDQLEAFGIVGPNEGSKAREVLFGDEFELEKYLGDLRKR